MTRAGVGAREGRHEAVDARRGADACGVADGVGPELRRVTGAVVSRHLGRTPARSGREDRGLRSERLTVPRDERAAADRWPGWGWALDSSSRWRVVGHFCVRRLRAI